jgi:sugar phosphate isomerase/epimerase
LTPTRRELLKSATILAAAVVPSKFSYANVSEHPSVDFPTKPQERLAVTSYPFRSLINSPTNHAKDRSFPGMDLKEFPAFAAKNFGIKNINPLVDHLNSTDPAYLQEFRKAVDASFSRIVDLGVSGRRFYAADKSVRQAAVAYGRKCVDIAAQVGSPSIRQHVSGQKEEQPDVSLAAESLGELAEYGAKKSIVINLENDSAVSEDPFFLTAVIEKVKSPYLRALPDFGNSLIGHDQEFNSRAVRAMLSHVFNICHVKDTVEGDGGARSKVDLAALFAMAKEASYLGFYSMEFDTGAGDPIAGTKQLVKETLQYLT